MILGQRTDISSVEAIQKDLGLDKPVYLQYINFLNDLSPISYHSNDPESYWYLDDEKYTSYSELVGLSDQSLIVLKKPYLRKSYQTKKKC